MLVLPMVSEIFSFGQTTSLGAITVRSEEQKRGLPNFKPNFECSHHYANYDSILRGAHSRFATTSMRYRLPAVILEDIELHVRNIMCSESTIMIDFPSSNLLTEAEMAWKDLSQFLVISSHAGCNGEGARAPYLVLNVDYISKFHSAVLSAKRIEWSNTYDKMEVKFGMGLYESSSLRVHGDLSKRTTTIVSVTSSETVSFSSTSSATPTASTSVHDISYSVPADFDLGNFSVATAGANETSSIKCAKCSIESSIELTQGVFTISDSSLDIEKATNFLEYGYFDAVVNGLGAHIEIDAAISGTFSEIFQYESCHFDATGFSGPMWIPTIRGAINVSTNLEFTYGFEVAVPDDSSIRLNIGNLSDFHLPRFQQHIHLHTPPNSNRFLPSPNSLPHPPLRNPPQRRYPLRKRHSSRRSLPRSPRPLSIHH
ncbi:553541fb-7ee0-4d50-9050-d9834299b06a [Sclerotinia trifoliorum]|uniref:553541fb-7ee0-4d50-9050-d9834299b06a n=1 Tax=Sclerotinia trifoliorum TaxID=28548 RepID=A0A8H2VYC6_9HELO|nr:553541fb-7ee0-4d50-9050-d9834299b06a [Sclerotinia trifoliorum]